MDYVLTTTFHYFFLLQENISSLTQYYSWCLVSQARPKIWINLWSIRRTLSSIKRMKSGNLFSNLSLPFPNKALLHIKFQSKVFKNNKEEAPIVSSLK